MDETDTGNSGPSRRKLLTAAAALAAFTSAGKAVGQTIRPHALGDFFTDDQTLDVALSPDGSRIAIIRELRSDGRRRAVLDLISADDPSRPPVRTPLGDFDCEAMQWANDSRVLIRILVTAEVNVAHDTAQTLVRAGRREISSRRMISVDPATGAAVVLFDNDRRRMRRSRELGLVVDTLPNDPDNVLMISTTSVGMAALYRVNVMTGAATQFERGGNKTIGWSSHDGVPVLRYDLSGRRYDLIDILARPPGGTEWKLLRRLRLEEAPDFSWISGTDQPGVIVVSARQDGEDVESVRELDLRTLAFGPPIAAREGHDAMGGLSDDRGRYLAATFWGHRLEYEFADRALAPHHRAMNRFFEDRCNVALVGADATTNRLLAYVSGPQEPGAWYLYDRTARSFVNLTARTMLEAGRLAPMEALRVTTRDGAAITAYLTAPPGGAPGPLVVMPHGGPEVRDTMEWDRQVQVLAAQGWWVLQPNFRGSGGYGAAFAQAGWRRWGERMQEDVEDAVAHALKLRGLDAERVAIMGASYGGYAALMGAVRRPDLYKAAISICGVGDLPDMLNWEKAQDDGPGQPSFNFWSRRIGQLGVDDAMMAAASPRRRAGEIVCPVLLVHGVDDPVVPVSQSRRMHDALRAAGKTVELVEVADAGHGDWEDADEKVLLGRYIALLSRAFA